MENDISLLQMLKYSGVCGLAIILIGLLQIPAWLLAAIRAGTAFGATGREADRAIRSIEGGGDAGSAVAGYHAATYRAVRRPTGFLALGGLGGAVGLFGWAAGSLAMYHVVANSPTAPSPAELAGGQYQALVTIWMGAFLFAATLFWYVAFSGATSLADHLGRRRVLAARPD